MSGFHGSSADGTEIKHHLTTPLGILAGLVLSQLDATAELKMSNYSFIKKIY